MPCTATITFLGMTDSFSSATRRWKTTGGSTDQGACQVWTDPRTSFPAGDLQRSATRSLSRPSRARAGAKICSPRSTEGQLFGRAGKRQADLELAPASRTIAAGFDAAAVQTDEVPDERQA